MANLERHFMESPYHYCSRCGRRRQLSKLNWQQGLLICVEVTECFDSATIGSREATISRVLSNTNQELQPDKKLTSPAAANSLIEEIIL